MNICGPITFLHITIYFNLLIIKNILECENVRSLEYRKIWAIYGFLTFCGFINLLIASIFVCNLKCKVTLERDNTRLRGYFADFSTM